MIVRNAHADALTNKNKIEEKEEKNAFQSSNNYYSNQKKWKEKKEGKRKSNKIKDQTV